MFATYLKLFLTAVFWGGTFIAGRIIARQIDPFSAAFLRFFIASVFLLAITYRVEGHYPPLSKKQIVPVLLLAMTGIFAYNVFFFKGLSYISASRASLIIANNPIFIGLLSALFYKEKLTLLKLTGILLSISGAIVVISRGNLAEIFSGGIGRGELFILGCVACWVAYSLIGKAVMVALSPIAAVTYATVIGSAVLAPAALYSGLASSFGHINLSGWLSLFYLGFFGTVLGFLWYYEGIRKIGAGRASIFINFVPVSAIIMAFFILAEPLTISLFAGAVLVITGVYFTNTAG